MAITIDWGQKIIDVPQSDLTLVSGTLYELDIDTFRLALKALEDDEEGMPFLRTHNHNTELTLSGVTYARTVEIINGYTVEFEDGQYSVSCVGANHNLSDVKVANQVSLIINNAAGLIGTAVLSDQQDARLTAVETLLRNKTITDPLTGKMQVYNDDGTTVLYTADLYEKADGAQPYRGKGAERRERLE